MSPESGLTTANLRPVRDALRSLPLLADAVEESGDFAKKNGQHPPDPNHPAEPVTTETSPSEDGLPPPQPISPEGQPPAAA